MVKVTTVTPLRQSDVTITLDFESAEKILQFLRDADTGDTGAVFDLWDALDDVVHLEIAESIKGIR